MRMNPEIRRFFVEEIRAAGALPEGLMTERVLDAFTEVPREDHAGQGPWMLRSPLYGLVPRLTPDADPAHLYHNVLIALNETQGINVGEPSMWANFFARTPIPEGASVLQVGAGSGYYTAILAELVGPAGQVLATEVNKKLADMASSALRHRTNVTVRAINGVTDLTDTDGPFDLVVAFAGVTHPAQSWVKRLKENGRMLLPITGDNGWGAMILAERQGDAFSAITFGRCGFFPCVGARDSQTANRVDKLWSKSSMLSDNKLVIRFEDQLVRYDIDGQTY